VTELVPWGSPASRDARGRLYLKHASLVTPDAMIAFVDTAVGDLVAALGRERFLVGEYARLQGEAESLRAARDALAAELADAREGLHRSATREQALAVQNAHLAADVAKATATLGEIYRSRAWRLFTPWWKLKERLGR
jgi:hypothetical protein